MFFYQGWYGIEINDSSKLRTFQLNPIYDLFEAVAFKDYDAYLGDNVTFNKGSLYILQVLSFSKFPYVSPKLHIYLCILTPYSCYVSLSFM